MSFVEGIRNKEIDNLIQSSLKSEHKLEWIPYSQITDREPSKIYTDYDYDAICKQTRDDGSVFERKIMLLRLVRSCTSSLVSRFAQVYSLPTHKYNDGAIQFGR